MVVRRGLHFGQKRLVVLGKAPQLSQDDERSKTHRADGRYVAAALVQTSQIQAEAILFQMCLPGASTPPVARLPILRSPR